MKFVLLLVIGVLLWNNNDARQFTSDMLQKGSDIVSPEPQHQTSNSLSLLLIMCTLLLWIIIYTVYLSGQD